jgi:hypothetical protein
MPTPISWLIARFVDASGTLTGSSTVSGRLSGHVSGRGTVRGYARLYERFSGIPARQFDVVPWRDVPVYRLALSPSFCVVGSVVTSTAVLTTGGTELEVRDGTDGIATSQTGMFSSPTINATPYDVGRFIVLNGTDSGKYLVAEYHDVETIRLVAENGESVCFIGGENAWSFEDLSYTWEFISVPIGSRVREQGFKSINPEGSRVTFYPDIVGDYIVGLTVSNCGFSGEQVTAAVNARAALIPQAQGIVPDGKWVWNYLRDCWTGVEDREWFETLWSSLVQLVGNDMLRLYQNDFQKSIRDIQDLYQRRWLKYEPRLNLEGTPSFYLGTQKAGTDAVTNLSALPIRAVILDSSRVFIAKGPVGKKGSSFNVTHSLGAPNIKGFGITASDNLSKTLTLDDTLDPSADTVSIARTLVFQPQSTSWTCASGHLAGTVVGDVIWYQSGPNAGLYIVNEIGDTYVVVDRPSAAASTAATASVHHPVVAYLTQDSDVLTDTIGIPQTAGDLSSLAQGRVVVVNGTAHTVLRVEKDDYQVIPLYRIITDRTAVVGTWSGVPWRIPHTLKSDEQTLDELGVTTGDVLRFDIQCSTSPTVESFSGQVVGVDGDRCGFVLSTDSLVPGVIPALDVDELARIADSFSIPTLANTVDGMTVVGRAARIVDEMSGRAFASRYHNQELTGETSFVTSEATFTVTPRYILRNTRIPVDDTLRSVPLLQEKIKVTPGNTGRLLYENSDFIIDDEYAYKGPLTFLSGTDYLLANLDLVDRNVSPGDVFHIEDPAVLHGDYIIEAIIDQTTAKLTRTIPPYVLGESVDGNVSIRRSTTGRFMRLATGVATAAQPLPDRLWAELSLFDNSETIENNFGLLVGLTKQQLDDLSSTVNYRQAVAGLMFAYTKGTSISRTRMGAHILLGLPFAESKGIIRSIDQTYRTNRDGDPIQGRILVEDIASNGLPNGTTRIYTYPVDANSRDLSGIEINPATDTEYAVGDVVELFSPLCKGVEIKDYITDPVGDWVSAAQKLQQFHTVSLTINDDFFSVVEMDLVSQFLKKITPSYLALSIGISSEYHDDVGITDYIQGVINGSTILADDVGTDLSTSSALDNDSPFGFPRIRLNDGVFTVRRFGRDLITTDGSTVVRVDGGGLIDPRDNESFDAPLCIGQVETILAFPEDRLIIIDGPNAGMYNILDVVDDYRLSIDAPVGLEAGTFQYAVVRLANPCIFWGYATYDVGATEIVVQTDYDGGLRTFGVSPGDWVMLANLGGDSEKMYVAELAKGITDHWDTIKFPTGQVTKFAGPSYVLVYRPHLIPRDFDYFFTVTGSGTNTITMDSGSALFMDAGDELVFDQRDDKMRVTLIDVNHGYVIPAVPAGTHTVLLAKRNSQQWPLALNFLRGQPEDAIEVEILSTAIDAEMNGVHVQFTTWDPVNENILPGDSFVATGLNAVETGNGLGVYVVTQVEADLLHISPSSVATETITDWKIIRRR